MKMKRVLAEKIKRKHNPLYHIAFDASVRDAAQMMTRENIGAMLVDMPVPEDGVYAGIISERDIIRSCANYPSFENLPISKIMSKNLINADIEDSVRPIVVRMRQHHIRHIPLVENGKVTALLSIRDLMYCVDMEREATLSHMSDMLGACSRNINY
ncbi:MAG: CBS domain-containing protein [Victivallales bacterium]|nr:CBS domain-containing protein [Victivallales bacterium]